MNWKLKWAIQKACASVPLISQPLYYQLQQRLGPVAGAYDTGSMLAEAARMTRVLRQYGQPVEGASVMEVGSGWRLDIPLGLYLCGARETLAFDANRYLRESLVLRSLDYLRTHEDHVHELFRDVTEAGDLKRRLDALVDCRTLAEVLAAAGIRYFAPADAARTPLPGHSIDIHFSYTVFEHIPRQVLTAILCEASRLLRPSGVAMHHIDLSDHSAHVDPSITLINFLQYSDRQWRWFASTPWSYHNRLRVDAYRDIYTQAGHELLSWNPHVDRKSIEALEYLPLDSQYQGVDPATLCTVYLDVVSRAR